MKIFYLPKFSRKYKKLPNVIKDLVEEKEKIFRNDPFDKSLKTHKLHGNLSEFWSFSIDRKYRIIFEFIDNGDIRFYSVGNHDIYY